MPFNDNLPAENTDPWYGPLVTAWGNLKTFVNGVETAAGNAASAAAAAQTTANGRATVASVTAAQSAADAAQTTANGRATVASVTAAQAAADAAQTTANGRATTASVAAKVTGLNGATGLWIGTQEAYDAIATPTPTVAYFVVG